MLKGFLKSKEVQIKEQVDQHLADGMKMLTEKFYNGALIEFDKAMKLNKDEVYPRLKNELGNFANGGNLESALSIGLNLIKIDNSDFELANKLGNYARELENYQQAEGLYKLALKAKKNYEPAFYNLAACMARVDKYDDAVSSSLDVFESVTDYKYPDLVGPENLLEVMGQEIESKKEIQINEKIQELQLTKEEKLNEGATVEAAGLDLDIKKLRKEPLSAQVNDFIDAFQRLIENDAMNANNHMYNLALYCVQNDKFDIASDALSRLSTGDFDYKILIQNIILAKTGKLEAAIKDMSRILAENEYNRFNNVNLGLMYRKAGKKFLATKYLIKTASLLEKSGGIYSMKELVKLAHQSFDEGNMKKALNFYKIACTENPDAMLWLRMGQVYQETKKWDEASKCYKKLLEQDPDNKDAVKKIKEVHDYFFHKAEELTQGMKYKPAADYIHKALGIKRYPETVKKAAAIYGQLKQAEKEEEYLDEYRAMMDEIKNAETEAERQKLIAEAKVCMKTKNYLKAIQHLESALRMKVDKQVFMQLAGIYKGLKKTEDLQSLISRWEKMVEHEEKMRKFEKEKERE